MIITPDHAKHIQRRGKKPMKKTLLSAGTALMIAAMPLVGQAEPATFESPEAGAEALISALRGGDTEAVLEVFGPESKDVIVADDPERNRADREDFIAGWDEMSRVAVQDDGTARIYIGTDQWPFPISLVKAEGGWQFDVEAGREELIDRRIGRNELDVIEVMEAYVVVQSAFRGTDYDEDGVMEFARHILSSSGQRDGLYWPQAEGIPESPIGDAIARASAQGYEIDGEATEPEPYLGYYFHILEGQAEGAPGGAMSYLFNDNMVAGHAMIAYPADYGETGIMSFLVGENGTVHEADLGDETIEEAGAIELFDPSAGWTPVANDVN